MGAIKQPRRVNQVGASKGIQDVANSHTCRGQSGGVRGYLEFRYAPTLYHDGSDTIQSVEPRFDVVISYFPKLFRGNRIGRQAVTDDRECREDRAPRSTSADPRLVTERTFCKPGTLFTASSMGRVTVTSI